MVPWLTLYRDVKRIVRNSKSIDQGLKKTIAYARKRKRHFDQPYWDQIETSDLDRISEVIISWAKAGLKKIKINKREWNLLILDLGDCPDIFRLSGFIDQSVIDERKLRRILSSKTIISYESFYDCFRIPMHPVDFEVWVNKQSELVYHNLNHEQKGHAILSPHLESGPEYLFWLAIGSLALIEPWRNMRFRKEYLNRSQRLYLLSGFKETFFHLGTIESHRLSWSE